MTTHGLSGHPLYGAWLKMIDRCEKTTCKSYRLYGAMGVSVHPRWKSFANFVVDVGPRPSDKYSLDRYPNNNGNYEPGNVRWATAVDQGNNRRDNHLVTIEGETLTLTQWARRFGVASAACAGNRIRSGWEPLAAISTPPLPANPIARFPKRSEATA